MSNRLAIACALSPEAHNARLTWIAELNRAHLRAHHRSGRTLVLTYSSEAAPLAHELARREQECCAFLDFTLSESSRAPQRRITVPQEASEGSDALLAPFLEGPID